MLDNISQIAIHNGGSLTPLIIPSELTDGTGENHGILEE